MGFIMGARICYQHCTWLALGGSRAPEALSSTSQGITNVVKYCSCTGPMMANSEKNTEK